MVHLTTALDPASAVPLYEQLYRSLAAEMRAGTLTAGTRMPGKRRLAAELSVSVNTVDAAYQILATEGYMEPRERSGFYVQEYLALPTRPEEVPPPVSAAPPEAAEPSVRPVPNTFPFLLITRMLEFKISLSTSQISLNTTFDELLLCSNLLIFLVLSNN
jgi:GntR family transcriptional regulator/MocR family aminotransferase